MQSAHAWAIRLSNSSFVAGWYRPPSDAEHVVSAGGIDVDVVVGVVVVVVAGADVVGSDGGGLVATVVTWAGRVEVGTFVVVVVVVVVPGVVGGTFGAPCSAGVLTGASSTGGNAEVDVVDLAAPLARVCDRLSPDETRPAANPAVRSTIAAPASRARRSRMRRVAAAMTAPTIPGGGSAPAGSSKWSNIVAHLLAFGRSVAELGAERHEPSTRVLLH